ncbi:hypothetical protein KJ359_004602 [Pestalotiopsis sp. 9143b]|nr:hypothetical protein KJ359_004602 [Pestalotiopsis sp. 9143b]
MCLIQRQVCIPCKYRDAELDEEEIEKLKLEKFVIEPCEEFTDIIAELKRRSDWTPEKPPNFDGRFHCPDFQWPPTSDATCYFVCEECLCAYYYEWRDMVTEAEDSDTSDLTIGRDDQEPSLLEFAQSKLPQEPARFLCRAIENRYNVPDGEDDEETKFLLDGIWFSRAKEAAYRYVTVLMPKCNLCDELLVHERENLKDADIIRGRRAGQDDEVNAEKTNEKELDNIWTADVEFEPNIILWKWLALLHQNETGLSVEGQTDILMEPVETYVKTGFLFKPCTMCIAKEFQCRKQVCQFVAGNVTNSQVWMVFNWLMTRGCGNVPMFDHAAISFGYPNTEPPTDKEMMSLMAETWKRMSGVPWHEVDFLEPPTFSALPCDFPITVHDVPLVKLSQLPPWRRMTPLERRHILPGLEDVQESETSEVIEETEVEAVEKDQPPKASALVRSSIPDESLIVTFKRGIRRKRKPKDFVQSSRVLKKLKRSRAHMRTMQIESGLSAQAMDKALSALIGVLSEGDDLPLPGSFQLRNGQQNAARVAEQKNAGAHVSVHGQHQATPGVHSMPQRPTPITEDEQSPAATQGTTSTRNQMQSRNPEIIELGEDASGDDLDDGDWKKFDDDDSDDDVVVQDSDEVVLELEANEAPVQDCDLGHTHLMEPNEACDGLNTTGGTLFFLPIGWSCVSENDSSHD